MLLDDGTVEVLRTSLYDEEEGKSLYAKRWGVETYFDRLRNLLEVELLAHRDRAGLPLDRVLDHVRCGSPSDPADGNEPIEGQKL